MVLTAFNINLQHQVLIFSTGDVEMATAVQYLCCSTGISQRFSAVAVIPLHDFIIFLDLLFDV